MAQQERAEAYIFFLHHRGTEEKLESVYILPILSILFFIKDSGLRKPMGISKEALAAAASFHRKGSTRFPDSNNHSPNMRYAAFALARLTVSKHQSQRMIRPMFNHLRFPPIQKLASIHSQLMQDPFYLYQGDAIQFGRDREYDLGLLILGLRSQRITAPCSLRDF
ncbi:MAG: hypothetical protein LWX11_09595 [Firmicutes bacterium]|nr:hypothetical protein [Bacillota bacterium]